MLCGTKKKGRKEKPREQVELKVILRDVEEKRRKKRNYKEFRERKVKLNKERGRKKNWNRFNGSTT